MNIRFSFRRYWLIASASIMALVLPDIAFGTENLGWIFFALVTIVAVIFAFQSIARNRLLSDKTQELEASRARLDELGDYRQQFFANVNHEFRTPLNAIQGFSQAILHRQSEMSREQLIEYVALIEKSSCDLTLLTENVLDLSRMDAGSFDFVPEDVSLTRLVEAVVTRHRAIAAPRNIMIRFDIPGEWSVRCDRGGIGRCVGHLLSNAVKYSEQGASVDLLAYSRDAETFVVEVRDSGCGISEADLETIWMVYARPSQVRRSEQEGPGLGLAITKALMTAHKGSVEIESEEGAGTTVRLCFPSSIVVRTPARRRPVRIPIRWKKTG